MVQDDAGPPPAGSDRPLRLTLVASIGAENVKPSGQLEVKPLGVATFKPGPSVLVKLRFVEVIKGIPDPELFVITNVKLSVVAGVGGTGMGTEGKAKFMLILGGENCAQAPPAPNTAITPTAIIILRVLKIFIKQSPLLQTGGLNVNSRKGSFT